MHRRRIALQKGEAMKGYALQIMHPALGNSVPKVELVYVLSEDEASAEHLVRVALRLGDEAVKVVGELSDEEVRLLELKAFDVRHARSKE